MDGRDLVRAVRTFGTAHGLRAARSAWRRRRDDAEGLPPRGAERARVPGPATGAEPLPGGGTVRFARSELRIVVTVGGAVFRGWDGALPEPSYALAGAPPEPDPRAGLEPDMDGGWRVVSERLTVAVSRHGAVEIRTPGGVVLRRDLPPRWWEPAAGGTARWVQRSEIAADARVFGLGGRASGPRLRDGSYLLWNTAPRAGFGPEDGPLHITMPVQTVVADAGTHLAFHDNSWEGRVTVREGEEGAGSGHDRPGTVEVRMDGGPLRSWVLVGAPARVLSGWAQLTGAPALPPSWALGPQHMRRTGGEDEVRRTVETHRDLGLPLSAVHVGGGVDEAGPADRDRFPGLPALAKDLRGDGVRLVRSVAPAVPAEPEDALYRHGSSAGLFVRDARAAEVRGTAGTAECVFPDFTDARVREAWDELYGETAARGFSGVWLDRNEPVACTSFDGATLPRSARHALDGRGGDHREAHNVYGLAMARAGYEGLRRQRPDERPFLVSRSGWAGMQRYGGAWAGDVTTGWPGLRASLSLVLGLGLCGVPYSGTDVGGAGEEVPAELYLRRLQLAAYLPLSRTTESGPPWAYGPEVTAHVRAALEERVRLGPYFVTLAQLARLTGAPYARPLWWRTPGERALRNCEDAFLLGDALLVAPVLEPGSDRRAVRLPRGRWYDTASGRPYEGPGQVLVDAPLSRIPVLARAGSVLPVLAGPGGGDGAADRVALEVWAPAAGRRGGGLVVRDTGDGWDEPEIERYTTRLAGGRVVVERTMDDGAVAVEGPVRVRGLE
ncbi:glycoside hydrolase family 31 protein [Streptomyces peucetius]|uniref:Glycoside hydrolase family 31 protein n=1 Tax=Streptomyces peucetius TaxID=1950 RepID=A0ABY6I5H0_STRPE|nr:glycoside hydrolase family 31 protein [Streptomyces peucetius]UYQ61000.1 glycoside hydrolase family 31 protein [Streptomyces peucetius]